MLGLDQLHYYDIYPPLVSLDKTFDLESSKNITLEASQLATAKLVAMSPPMIPPPMMATPLLAMNVPCSLVGQCDYRHSTLAHACAALTQLLKSLATFP